METRNCQNCKNDFTIEPDDFSFYEKIKVPPPLLCPECRQQRRYAWRNERTLYRRNCDLCQKSIVTIYSPDKPHKVYCLPCFWSDGWDPSIYGKDFDFSRPFFEQFHELQLNVPRMALLNKNSVNSDYTNHSGDNKNVYFSFSCFGNENLLYSVWVMNSRDCVDCSYIYEKGERLYECIDSQSSYQSQYCILINNSSNCYYCYDCNGCTDCFMSSNLRNQRYVFNNEQYSKEEYFEQIKQYDLSSYSVRENLFQQFIKMMTDTAIHKCTIGERNILSKGNMLFNCKNVIYSYDLDKSEDCKYIYGSLDIKDCMDIYHAGIKTELCYECHGCTRIYDTKFCHLCYDNSNLTYCDSCQNSSNLFGCVSIKKGEYYIFNKQYSKEEYQELKNKIIEHMKKTGEYGEFFPPSIAPVFYNETRGNMYMPLTKEEVLAKGWNWEDKVPGVFGKGTIDPSEIPDNINDIQESFTSSILTCVSCSKNYNITSEEFLFYKRESIPIPRKCPDCREKNRVELRLPRKLWSRACMCDVVNHGHENKCQNKFETSYDSERPEIVYCEDCYKKEIL
jgi:hypothetical protein